MLWSGYLTGTVQTTIVQDMQQTFPGLHGHIATPVVTGTTVRKHGKILKVHKTVPILRKAETIATLTRFYVLLTATRRQHTMSAQVFAAAHLAFLIVLERSVVMMDVAVCAVRAAWDKNA